VVNPFLFNILIIIHPLWDIDENIKTGYKEFPLYISTADIKIIISPKLTLVLMSAVSLSRKSGYNLCQVILNVNTQALMWNTIVISHTWKGGKPILISKIQGIPIGIHIRAAMAPNKK